MAVFTQTPGQTRLTGLTADQRRALDLLDIRCGTPAGWLRHRRLHEPACRPCVLAYERTPGTEPAIRPRCGTPAGWLDHRRRHELACTACQAAQDQDDASACGSYTGWMRHRRRGTPFCGPCVQAQRDYQNSRKDRRKSRARIASNPRLAV